MKQTLREIWNQSKETGSSYDRIVLCKPGLLSRNEVFIGKALSLKHTATEILEFLKGK